MKIISHSFLYKRLLFIQETMVLRLVLKATAASVTVSKFKTTPVVLFTNFKLFAKVGPIFFFDNLGGPLFGDFVPKKLVDLACMAKNEKPFLAMHAKSHKGPPQK